MLSLQTNINSLVAQQNLNVNNTFQSKTIEQLTSGYRINSSGDDAAGLAVANRYRSMVAELTQGVANGNDGVASLQIMDGGINNIAQMLDRLKTLAMQSASASFTGGVTGRAQLNSEFQTDITEIDRQAQSIGLNTAGTFAKSLGVYFGSGTGSTSSTNGQVNVDLSKATVDSQSLGLSGMQAGNNANDLSTAAITAITTNATNTAASHNATFQFFGPGFGDGVNVTIDTTNVKTDSDLTAALNTALTSAGISNAAFAASGITASITTASTTDSNNGHQVLTFTSGNAAFQVRANDLLSNGLMGNFAPATGLGNTVAATMTGRAYTGAGTAFAGNQTISVTLNGGGLSAPVTISTNVTATNHATDAVTALAGITTGGTSAGALALQAAGISIVNNGGHMDVVSKNGQAVQVQVAGDVQGLLNYGDYVAPAATSQTGSVNASAPGANGNVILDLSIGADTSQSAANQLTVTVATGDNTAALQAADINAALTTLAQTSPTSNWVKAGIVASTSGNNVVLTSNNGTAFRVGVADASKSGLTFVANATAVSNVDAALPAMNASFAINGANGEYQLGTNGTAAPLAFTPIQLGTDAQAVTISASDATGGSHSLVVNLNTGNATSIDQAIHTINQALQSGTDSTLKTISAVKVRNSGTEEIQFVSNTQNFSVNVGATGSGAGMAAGTSTSTKVGAGGALDISTLSDAQAAVSAITNAVGILGTAQAAVGKGQNQLNYAISLAQSQITNFSAAESTIRDANVAQEAANLTKAQVLQQASIAAMVQANSAPQAILTLLRG